LASTMLSPTSRTRIPDIPQSGESAFALRQLVLSSEGSLREGCSTTGSRECLTLGTGLNRARSSPTDPPSLLTWTTDPREQVWDVVGSMEVVLDAASTAIDTAWILTLRDVAPDGLPPPVKGRRHKSEAPAS